MIYSFGINSESLESTTKRDSVQRYNKLNRFPTIWALAYRATALIILQSRKRFLRRRVEFSDELLLLALPFR